MRIYLFLNDKIKSYLLPEVVEGSYRFYDINDDKLINIESRDNSWVIYSTINSQLINNNYPIRSLELKSNTYYVIRNNNINYLVYTVDLRKNGFLQYSYKHDLNLVVGSSANANIIYNCGLFNGEIAKIYYENNEIKFNYITTSNYIYINENAICQNQVIKIGDKINFAGLSIIFLKEMLIITKIPNVLLIKDSLAKIEPHNFSISDKPMNLEIKDKDLYNDNDYFQKAPRIRRIIKTKKLKLSPPPSKESDQELPLILTAGPMLTMGVTSVVMLSDTMTKINTRQTTWKDSWSSIVSSSAMLISMIVWPLVTSWYNKYSKKKRRRELIKKYSKYLEEKREELSQESKTQKDILLENLISVDECKEIIINKSIKFWDKRIDQSDFLVVRVGMGKVKLDAEVEYPDDGFTIEEDELKKQADKMVNDFKYIENVPVGYSLLKNTVTAVMGYSKEKCNIFVDNIILQLLSFYSYEDLKIVMFTNEENKSHWEYLKYLNHSFTNDLKLRFFSSCLEDAKNISEYLNIEVKKRLQMIKVSGITHPKPHYLIITDDYSMIKKFDYLKEIEETNENIGFSLLIIEQKLGKLPSKCSNFITLNKDVSEILQNSYEEQEQIAFKDEINNNINMMEIVKICANVPIELESESSILPNNISFLEMEHVGKVEQLNILNRWKSNDATRSLKAEIGIAEDGEPMYLDLHEKFHGPHGLIAGTTGSGKSEFIITYILSMCINYSPDEVSFILIDYKGGGLALAFENKTTGVSLPHLAGTITNLDKAEMDRTLVSIDSEVKRRQRIFNEARDKLEESTIDIYKYQKFYNEGKLTEAISHLFIICDEFAELKSQQPDFMDNLISIARIGRSLGIHLILATQKPSGVVNDQIWSNTKFRICLKVQDESDSKEMLKRPDAAYITQAGRYYLQVGYDEIFALGQSGYCGAKYYPSDSIVKHVDKSISFIDNTGFALKSIEATSEVKKEAQGEQLSAIMKNIIELSNKVNIKARKLWLDNIPDIILVDNLVEKYKINKIESFPQAILGEYDAPEKQEQGLVLYNYLKDGNTIIYGTDGSERELLLSTLIYSTAKNYTADEVNLYLVDYGSESLRRYLRLPQIGGMVFLGEDEKFNNLLKMIKEELKNRKKLFINYGGEYKNYIKDSTNKIPLKVIILNNYDSIFESNQYLYDDLPELVRDSERYGIIFILTCSAINSVYAKISQNFNNIYSFRLTDSSDYSSIFNTRTDKEPRSIFGRGLINNDGVHEFQTANILTDENKFNEYIINFINEQKAINQTSAKRIPVLPNIIRINDIENEIKDLMSVPIGISKNSLEIIKYDFISNICTIVSSNKLINTKKFILSLFEILKLIVKDNLVVIDSGIDLIVNVNNYKNYYNNNFDYVIENLNKLIDNLISNNSNEKGMILIYGVNKFLNNLEKISNFETLLEKLKRYEKFGITIVEDTTKLKNQQYENWFNNNFSASDGIWIGRGVSDSIFKLSTLEKEMMEDIKNNMGYFVQEGIATKVKFIDFISNENDGDENE